MSRLIVKDLPKKCTELDIRRFFSRFSLTEIVLYQSRRFCFVGFVSSKQAELALKLSNTYLNTSKVQIFPAAKKKREFLEVQNGRLLVINLHVHTKESELKQFFQVYGEISDIILPYDRVMERIKGYAFVQFVRNDDAATALQKENGSSFKGRVLEIKPAEDSLNPVKKVKKEVSSVDLLNASNIMLLDQEKLIQVIAEKHNVSPTDILHKGMKKIGVKVAQMEMNALGELKTFFRKVGLDPSKEKSSTCFLVKNINQRTKEHELREAVEKNPGLLKLEFPKSLIVALCSFKNSQSAEGAFNRLNFFPMHGKPLLLEWANIENAKEEIIDINQANSTLFVKNLSFDTSAEELNAHFSRFWGFKSVVLKKGIAFVEYDNKENAMLAFKKVQGLLVNGHRLEVAFSQKKDDEKKAKRKESNFVGVSERIVIKNISFQVNMEELQDVVSSAGEYVDLRLPCKANGHIRGYAFVECHNKEMARTLAQNLEGVHLYGRRLVIEDSLL